MTEQKQFVVYQKETMLESISSDVVTFGFLFLCMWFSYDQGGGWWTFFTCSMFLITLCAKLPGGAMQKFKKLKSKREAIEWANNLPDDTEIGQKSKL